MITQTDEEIEESIELIVEAIAGLSVSMAKVNAAFEAAGDAIRKIDWSVLEISSEADDG